MDADAPTFVDASDRLQGTVWRQEDGVDMHHVVHQVNASSLRRASCSALRPAFVLMVRCDMPLCFCCHMQSGAGNWPGGGTETKGRPFILFSECQSSLEISTGVRVCRLQCFC